MLSSGVYKANFEYWMLYWFFSSLLFVLFILAYADTVIRPKRPKMTFDKQLYATENPAKFSKFQPLIDTYNQETLAQIKAFDSEFYDRCKASIPDEKILDSEPIDAKEFLSLLSEEEKKIVNEYTMVDLTSKQLSGELSAEEIANAYIKSAIIAHLATNAALQFLIPEALAKAKELDAHLKATGKLVGPLHGVPVSLKEQMNFKGKPTHASYVSYITNIPKNSAVSIDILDKLGAIFHTRTSQPQAIMHLDTWNNITGRTRNPCSTRLSPGGSSGGESAMVGMHGSVIGHGSDIGGSIRVPAAFVDLFGIRPTTRRISSLNGLSGGKGQESIVSTQGPIARSIDELDYYMKAYINEGKPWEYDSLCVPIPWREANLPSKIKIGVLSDDNLVTPYPAVSRAIAESVEKLKADDSFEIIDLSPYWYSEAQMEEIYDVNVSLYTCDGNKVQLSMFEESGEPLLPMTRHFLEFGGGKEHTIYQNRMFNAQRDALKVEMMDKYFGDLGLDFILSPTYVGPSEKAAETKYWGYSSFWNLLDYPNVVFPTGVVHDVGKDAQIPSNLKSNKYEKMVWCGKDGSLEYDAEDYIGGPVALQLTGKRYCDEDVVAATKRIVEVLKIERR